MTKQEFENRVKVQVTDQEYYSVIEPMYMNSDVDKDEFCAMWRKMNHKRVKACLADQLKCKQEQERKDRLFDLKWKIECLPAEKKHTFAVLYCTEKQMQDLKDVGIETEGWNKWLQIHEQKSLSDIHYDLLKFFGQIR
ncbi:hypothetical protein [Sodaliphilus pleomorphus]|uniref:Uncharacterized protein n=1 Tax=Sodaliphilus pleomorphus TaxID=2606626 RepID=A0A6L5XC34_9BACT|nr:hypothetical protein [Sodaliphilus pleomorphus]MSS16823.1 hypothetical protein [Sodaliphilus pleomorphus]